ncbi:hypothetical protein SAMN05192533_12166 [Mesobacillus persicus]|uniref:Uncharacterized protein n=1 Tax=Mesobacillus persicus TaxID=930146 RepID=A0A1H8JKM6_9BACI|nr:hypothetical protein [Mesobacillus persicus]SEN81085.1 hypothetical protein SAMN05192533_12166 [Mesobacillus persicus]
MEDLLKQMIIDLKIINASVKNIVGNPEDLDTKLNYVLCEIKAEQEKLEKALFTQINEQIEMISENVIDGLATLNMRIYNLEQAVNQMQKRGEKLNLTN